MKRFSREKEVSMNGRSKTDRFIATRIDKGGKERKEWGGLAEERE